MYPGVKVVPERILSLPGDPDIAGAAFSRDGESVFVLTRYHTLHLGEFLDATLPIWLGIVCGVVVIWGLVRIVRALRRPREPGKRYCPRCNYCVTHDAGTLARCPECGIDLTQRVPVPGQTRARRVGVAVAALIAPAVCVYGVAALAALTVGVFSHVDWRSAWLGEKLAPQHMSGRWWGLGQGFSQTLYRADIATGALTRVGDYDGTTFCTLSVHPTSGEVYLEVEHDHITRVNPASGKIMGRLVLSADSLSAPDDELVLDHTPAHDAAFTQWQDWTPAGRYSMLGLWHLDTSSARPLARIDPSDGAPGNTYPRQFITKGDATSRFVIALPHPLESRTGQGFLVHTFEQLPGQQMYTRTHGVDLGAGLASYSPAMISLRDQSLLVIADGLSQSGSGQPSQRPELRAFDLAALQRGEVVLRWTIPLAALPREGLALSPDETTIYAKTTGGVAEIDIAQRGMQRLLAYTSKHVAPRALDVSSTHVLARSTRPVGPSDAQGNPHRYTADLIIWRVR